MLERGGPPELYRRQVVEVLRNLHRDHRLTKSAFLRTSALVGPQRTPQRLRDVIRGACERLGEHGENAKHREILQAGYLSGRVKQEVAAAAVGMSYGSYRRHLRHAIDHLTNLLWLGETAGVSADMASPVPRAEAEKHKA